MITIIIIITGVGVWCEWGIEGWVGVVLVGVITNITDITPITEEFCVEVVVDGGARVRLMRRVAGITGDGHIVAASDETDLGDVAHVEEEFGDGADVFVEQRGNLFGSEGAVVVFVQEGEDVLALLGETVVNGGAEEGPAHGVGGQGEGEFLIGEVGASEQEGCVGLSSVMFEDEEGVGEDEGGIVSEFVEWVAIGFGGELLDEEDGEVVAVGEGFEVM